MSWDLRQNTAIWTSPNWSIKIELMQLPDQSWLQIHDTARKVVLGLGITPNELDPQHVSADVRFGEAYVRNRDLIAIYPEHAPRRFGHQIDVRMLDEPNPQAIALEIWLSIQTSLLDSHPQLELRWDDVQFNASSENYWTSTSSQIGLMVHPLDQPDCHTERTSNGLSMRVFGRFMEKGVIRRMRFRLIAALDSEPENFWRERFAEFSESPLPLTT